jgi:DNA-binding response OmpR family regulator
MYTEYLRGEGFDVREVGTTDEALTLISDFDVVITGLMVRGDLNPLDFIRRARSATGRPIIVVTACVYAHSVTKAYDAGAHAVLIKPCLPDVLLHEVQRMIESPRVRLVAPRPRRSVEDRRSDLRDGRRDGEWFHTES